MKQRILITRPSGQAEETGGVFQSLGLKPIFSPVLKILPRLFKALPKNMGAVVVSSQNAVDALEGASKGLPCFCVGSGTAERLKKESFEKIYTSLDGTLKGLFSVIREHFSPEKGPLVYVRGEHVSENLSEFFRTQTPLVLVEERIVYEAQAVDCLTQEAVSLLKEGQLPFVTFFSRRSAQQFVTMMESEGLVSRLSQMCAVCLSAPIASIIGELVWKDVWVAPTPTLPGMVQILKDQGSVRKGNSCDSRKEQGEESVQVSA